MKAWQIARRILRQNRWLFLFLLLWPWGMIALLLIPAGSTSHGDVLSILREECFYGLALVAFTGSAQLGIEQRSRRIAAVLSRAVSRREYLFSLVMAAWIPLALYATSFFLSCLVLLPRYPVLLPTASSMAAALALLGLWTASLSVFFGAWLPTWLASIATLGLLSLSYLVGRQATAGLGHLWDALMGNLAGVNAGDIVIVILAAAVFFWAANVIFERRDLNLKGN